MKTKLLMAMLIAMVSAGGAAAQGRRPQPVNTPKVYSPPVAPKTPRRVTVRLKDKNVLSGNYLRADAEKIYIVVANNEMGIKLDDVAVVNFGGEPEAPAVAAVDQFDTALKALRKLAGATDVGISYAEYGTRVIDTKAEVEESLNRVPEGDRKEALKLALQAFIDARAAWSEMLRYDFTFPDSAPMPDLIKRYNIPIETMVGKQVVKRNTAISTIWRFAQDQIARGSQE